VFLEEMIRTWELQMAVNPKKTNDLLGTWIQTVNTLTGLARAFGLERVERKAIELKAYLTSCK
jgi:hypothetical protein